MSTPVYFYIEFKDELMEVILDVENYYLMGKYDWTILKAPQNYYVTRRIAATKFTRLHNEITGFKFVDHINGNGLDNRKENLRESNHKLNAQNRKRLRKNKDSKYKGVFKQRFTKKSGWIARIVVDGKQVYLGTFKIEKEAAIAYNKAAIKYFGEYSSLNEIKD